MRSHTNEKYCLDLSEWDRNYLLFVCGFGISGFNTTTQWAWLKVVVSDRKQPVTQQILFPRLQFLFVTLNDRFRKIRKKKHNKKYLVKKITKFVSVQIVASKQPVATFYFFLNNLK